MSDKEFALECLRVRQLDFVSQVNLPADVPYVFVELNLDLIAVLPSHMTTLKLLRSEFSVQSVIARFEEQVVDLLKRASDLAQEQLRSARWQMRNRK